MAAIRTSRKAVIATAPSILDDLRLLRDLQELLRFLVARGGALFPAPLAPRLGDVLVERDHDQAERHHDRRRAPYSQFEVFHRALLCPLRGGGRHARRLLAGFAHDEAGL